MKIWSAGDNEGKLGPWNTTKINGLVFPGVSSTDHPGACICIPEATRKRKTDHIKTHGKNKAAVVHQGYHAAVIVLHVEIYNQEQLDAYLAYLPQINPSSKITKVVKSTKEVKAEGPPAPSLGILSAIGDVDANGGRLVEEPLKIKVTESKTVEHIPSYAIEHPDLSMLGIVQCYILEIPTLKAGQHRDVRTTAIQALEVVGKEDKVVTKKVSPIDVNRDPGVRTLPDFAIDARP